MWHGGQSVGKWRRRFLDKRLNGLLNEPRIGEPRKFTDNDVERVVTLTLETTPAAPPTGPPAPWPSARASARAPSIESGEPLLSSRTKTFKLSKDPLFIEKVRDVVGLYLKPPDKALVLCVDEKSGIQALDRTAPLLPMRPGQIEGRTHDSIATALPTSLQP